MDKDGYAVKVSMHKAALWKGKRPLLSKLDFELTERCNNDCIHCYINLPKDDQSTTKKELTSAKITDLLKEAASLGCLNVRFSGGEPLLREDFEDIYLSARNLGLRVIIFTNATLITPALAGLFSRIPPLKAIQVSLYGMEPKSSEAITRTPGSHEAAWRGINLLLENRVPFTVKGTVLPQNKTELLDFESWASGIAWMQGSPSYNLLFDLRCRRDSVEKNRLIRQLRFSPDEVVGFLGREKEKYLQEMRQFAAKFMRPQGDDLLTCGAGTGGCVDAYGFFQPCMLLRHPDTVYDLQTGSLKDALVGFFPKVRQMKARNTDYLSRCARCFLKGLCEQCPAKSWMEHGTLDTPVDYFCDIAHAQARHAGMLKQGERAWEISDWQKRIEIFSQSSVLKQ